MNKWILTSCCVLLAWMVQAQDTLTQQATFYGELKIRLRDANKISASPEIIEQRSNLGPVKYSALPTRIIATSTPEKVGAIKVNVEDKLPYLYRGYLQAGMGTYATPYLSGYYTTARDRRGDLGVRIHHLSSQGGMVADSASHGSKYSHTEAELFGRYFLKNASTGVNVSYGRNAVGFYGNNPDLYQQDTARFTASGLRQVWQTVQARAFYESFSRDSSDMNYRGALKYRLGTGAYQEKENALDLTISGDKLVNTEVFSAEIGVQYNQFAFQGPKLNNQSIASEAEDSLIEARSFDNTVIRVIPSAYTVWRDVRVRVGMGVYVEGRSAKPTHFYPLAELKWSILDGMFLPYIGVKGGVELASFNALYEQNPFILSFPNLTNRNNKLEAYGGINGAVSSKIGYELGANWNNLENQAFFINDGSYSVGNRFTVVYDNLKQVHAHGRLFISGASNWKVEVGASYYQYNTATLERAWNMPSIRAHVAGEYRLQERWLMGITLNYIGERYAMSNYVVEGVTPTLNDDGQVYYVSKLKPFVDASLKVTYQYNKRLNAWLNTYNTLAQSYQMWNSYPTQRLVLMMGASYSF